MSERAVITRAAAGIGLYVGVFGITFGAVSVAAGLSVIQAVAMSAVMYTGASQFALVGVLAAGGSPLAGLSAALLLGLRNAFYGVPLTGILGARGLRRLWTAHFVVDESAAMAIAQRDPRAGRYAFGPPGARSGRWARSPERWPAVGSTPRRSGSTPPPPRSSSRSSGHSSRAIVASPSRWAPAWWRLGSLQSLPPASPSSSRRPSRSGPG